MWVNYHLQLYLNPFLLFTFLGVIFGVYYSWRVSSQYDWNPDYGHSHILDKVKNFLTGKKLKLGEKEEDETKPEKVPELVHRKEIFTKDRPPKWWRFERIFESFIGTLFGWWILWFLVDKRLNAFNGFEGMMFEWWDGISFIFGYTGINGNLPTIAHSVQSWLKRS